MIELLTASAGGLAGMITGTLGAGRYAIGGFIGMVIGIATAQTLGIYAGVAAGALVGGIIGLVERWRGDVVGIFDRSPKEP